MAVGSAVTSAVKKFYGKPMGYASKALGVAAVASVLYDAHINAKERSICTDQIESGDRFYNQYKQYMTMQKPSATISRFKKWWFNFQQSLSIFHIGSKVKGYLSGFAETLGNEVPVIALSTMALIPKKPVLNKTAGTFLALHGIKTLLYDVMGLGDKKTDGRF